MRAKLFLCFAGMVLVSTLALPAYGQNLFVKTLGGNDFDMARSIVEVSDGGLVVAGYTESYGAGSVDLLLAKFDGSGNHLWTRVLGGTNSDEMFYVIEVSDGGLVVTGYTMSYGAGSYDILLAKFDGSGNHLWTRTLGGTSKDVGLSVVEVSDGGVVVTAESYSFGAGYRDILLTKLDSSGNHLWTKVLGGNDYDLPRSVVEVSDGGFVVAGETESYGAGSIDLLLAKFDGSGNHLWTKVLGGTDSDWLYSVVEVSDGGLVVTGTTMSYGAGNWDLLLAKFDSSGNHLWTRTLGGTSLDGGHSVIEVSDGGLVVIGLTESYGAGDRDILLAKFDNSGNHLWTRTLGGNNLEDGYSVVKVSDERLVVTGLTESYGAGSYDILIAKFDANGNTCLGDFRTPVIKTPSPTITTPSPSVITVLPTVTAPTPIITSPTPTLTILCSITQLGSLLGIVSSGSSGLLGVPVNLVDSEGGLYATTTTDDSGYYRFDDVPNGDYTVELQVPLGYTPTSDQTVPITMEGEDVVVDFTLEENPTTGCIRQAWFWRWQVKCAIRGWGWAWYSGAELLDFLEQIHVHFDPHFSIYSGVEGLEGMDEILSARFFDPITNRAEKHFFATLLNVVSGRLNTFQVVSHDGAATSQAITYMAMLLTDEDPDNDVDVLLIALNINCAWFDLPLGVIPLDIPHIAYKFGSAVALPTEFGLSKNYPNPFNPVTEIRYELPEASRVRIEVYNALGQRVATLVDTEKPTGYHSVMWDGSSATSGLYFYRLQAGDFVETKKMILLK